VIDWAKIPAEGLRLEGQIAPLGVERGQGFRELEWRMFLLPSNPDPFVEVKGKAVWEGVCCKCLDPFDLSLNVDSAFLASQDSELVARGTHSLGSQDLDVIFLPEPVIDEDDLAREQFELQVPMHPVCRTECLGLCPQCGKNWNKGRCSCTSEPEKEPSALAKALAGLKLDLSNPEP